MWSSCHKSYIWAYIVVSKIIKEIDVKMLFRELKARFMANNMYCIGTKELVNRVEDMLCQKSITKDKLCLYTLQRLSAIKYSNNFATIMLVEIKCVLSQMIDDTRYPDLVRYNNIIEAKLSEYEKIIDKHIEYKGIEILDVIQRYTDELARYGEDCYKLSEDILYKISQVIVNDNSMLKNCSRSTVMTYINLIGDEHKRLVDSYSNCIDKSNEALHNFVDLLNKED